ncbi:hypothetical protein HY382_00485 [Candidatus Curtissbacteria bacterium]|nr:hypothetical protein [Candidatus Curtissbacteria bacterium]
MAEDGEGEKKMPERQLRRARESVAEKVSRVRRRRESGSSGGSGNTRDLLELLRRMRESGGSMPRSDEMSEQNIEPLGSDFRNDLIRRWHLLDQPDSPTAARVQERIEKFLESGDPYKILSARKEYDEFINTLTTKQKTEFERVVSQEQKGLMLAKVSVIEKNAKGLIGKLAAKDVLKSDEDLDKGALTNKELEARVKDIRDRAVYELGAIRSRWHSIEQAQALIISTAKSKLDYKGEEGLRAWIAFEEIRKIQEAAQIHERFQVKTDPIENIRTAEEVMRFFEQSKSPETFRVASQQLTELQQVVVNSQDSRISETMKEEFRKRSEAFITVNTLIYSSNSNEGNPTALHKIALEQFNDETWKYYFSRFTPDTLRDKEGEQYLVNEKGDQVEINIVGEALNVFAEQYLEDRFRMNIIESFSNGDFRHSSAVEAETLRELLGAVRMDEKMMAEITLAINRDTKLSDEQKELIVSSLAGLDTNNIEDSLSILNNIWKCNEAKTVVIRSWLAKNTLIGADGYEEITVGEGENMRRISVLRKDKWQEKVITEKLRDRLRSLGVSDERITKLMGTVSGFEERLKLIGSGKEDQENFEGQIGDFELLSAIKRNGYELAKLYYSDTLDRIRIYDNGKHINTVFGEDTPYVARVVSHLMDFAVSEKQGDERVNGLIMNLLNDKSGTILLPQNLTAVRILFQKGNILLGDTELKKYLDKAITDRLSTSKAESPLDVNAAVFYKFLSKGLDPTRTKGKGKDAMLEKITEVKWGEASDDMKSFEWHDMYDDRQKAFKWYMEKFRMWTLHPTEKEFFSMVGEYYSMRNVRRHPGAELYLEMMYDVGHHLKDWFGYKENLPDATYEAYIQRFREESWINETRANSLRNRVLGSEPSRSTRQLKSLSWDSLRKTLGSPGWWFNSLIDLLRLIFQYNAKQ